MVGLPGFEPGSLASEAKSLDQTSRQPHLFPDLEVALDLFITSD